MEKRKLTVDEAISLLGNNKEIHTFRNSSMMMFGADWNRDRLIDLIKANHETLEVGGEQCRNMGHGLVLNDGSNLFIEVDSDKLNELDPIN